MVKRILGVLIFVLPVLSVWAQRNVRDSVLTSTQFGLGYAFQMPAGDMAQRFGNNHNLGGSIYHKFKSNWMVGAEGGFFFGRNVSEPGLIQNLRVDEGYVLDNDGQIAEIRIEERGWHATIGGGYLFRNSGHNPNSGVMIRGGIGFMQHKIRLEHQLNYITQLEGEYLKGYDRLTNGLALTQFVGYLYSGNSRLVNFYVGLEATEAFTRGRRELYFDTLQVDDQPRFDMLLGVRVAWVLHIYRRAPELFYTY
ncbi:MAG: hypothetical protein KDC12_11125 [Flavobacteriales bacterium]|nr:hypothetical protein [Flavobacteriales bacterium]